MKVCISFLSLLQQITKDVVAQNSTDLSSYALKVDSLNWVSLA